MRKAGGTMAMWGTLLLRLMIGVVYVMHGYLALVILGPPTVASYITRMGYPQALATALAWYLVAAHLAGGVLIIIGLWTRWAALANVPPMASAVVLLHLKQGFFMTPVGPTTVGGYEFSLTVLVATIALVFLGSGALSAERS
jgi:putative oxidoreductase